MRSFEETCKLADATAKEIETAAKQIQRLARTMAKAASEGNAAKIRQAIGQIHEAVGETGRIGIRADQAWPISDENLTTYLEGDFVNDLIAATKAVGITLNQLDDRLAAFPVIVQILAKQRVVRIDAKRIASLRPTVVAERIRAQMKKSHSVPEQFIETLYKGYRLVVGDKVEKGTMLFDIYDALTLLPDVRRSYEKAEFFRDVYLLDTSGVRSTKSGATVTFPAATGTRGSAKTFTIIPPDGMPKYYYGVRFQEGVK